LFHNPEKAARELVESNEYLTKLHNDLIAGNLKDYRSKDYDKYFYVREPPAPHSEAEDVCFPLPALHTEFCRLPVYTFVAIGIASRLLYRGLEQPPLLTRYSHN